MKRSEFTLKPAEQINKKTIIISSTPVPIKTEKGKEKYESTDSKKQ
ncbi:hypothetical protein ACFDDV_10815 [Enterococcus lactis]|nr:MULTISPECIES: hypothetical protein [Enterococcus]MDB7696693.1 hypothetical protein [Enterococcus faecium]NWJ14228.1 hypothetical protein [Clostridium perfringens]